MTHTAQIQIAWFVLLAIELLVTGCIANPNQLLLQASERGDVGEVSRLIGEGADVNARHDSRRPDDPTSASTCLHVAAELGHAKVVQRLIDAGADVHARRANGDTPLLATLVEDYEPGQEEVVKALLDAGADVNTTNDDGYTPLHWAAASGWHHKRFVELLLEAGANVNAANTNGYTPLHMAASPIKLIVDGQWKGESEHYEVLHLLLDAGADVNAKNKSGKTPLDEVNQLDPRRIAEILEGATAKRQLP